MSENQGVWGIDIGQAGLKAVRLRYAEAAKQVVAVAFDYVPHAKILSQPDAVPEELIPLAVETFLARNETKGDKIAISLSAHNSFTKFIKLPPVESSKVGEIVRYEARQQIPFPLEDVVWDYQNLGAGVEESGFMLEAEVGLFAAKREHVHRALEVFHSRKIEVDLLQISSLALFNVLCYDFLGQRPEQESEGSDEYTIVVDMGADNSMLIVSNGEKIWPRNVPIGGNHFTRALSKEMKLTFAKAEHLKCNATRSPDPRAVFQALRPVFNEYVAEIQRSIGFFSSVNREAAIKRVLGAGNGFKLAGLQKFLQQNLQYDVDKLDRFQGLVGDAVLKAPLFEENVLAFAVPYGLALQALGRTKLKTNLLPPEIVRARKIRRKRPWALAASALVQTGVAASIAGASIVYGSVAAERWKTAEQQVDTTAQVVQKNQGDYDQVKTKSTEQTAKGEEFVEAAVVRDYLPEVYRAINETLPRDEGNPLDDAQIGLRRRIKLTSITMRFVGNLKEWYDFQPAGVRQYMSKRDQQTPPQGPGYVFRLEGLHYHYDPTQGATGQGVGFVDAHFLKRLQAWTIANPPREPFPVGQLGISHATIVESQPHRPVTFYPHGFRTQLSAGGTKGTPKTGGGPAAEPRPAAPPRPTGPAPTGSAPSEGIQIRQTQFTIEFAWRPTLRIDRPEKEPVEAPPPAPEGQPPVDGQPGADPNQPPPGT